MSLTEAKAKAARATAALCKQHFVAQVDGVYIIADEQDLRDNGWEAVE